MRLSTCLARIQWRIAIAFFFPMAVSSVFAQQLPESCGSLSNGFGPFDYRPDRNSSPEAYKSALGVVESHHFTPRVESLLGGQEGYIGGDLDYTLRAFPNHHRALVAMVSLGVRENTEMPRGSRYTVGCWLQRALAWRSDDHIARLIFAKYLVDKGRPKEAEDQLSTVATGAEGNAFTLQNIGLIYVDMKMYDKALEFAHKAYRLGLGIPTLRDQLQKAGKWTDAPPAD